MVLFVRICLFVALARLIIPDPVTLNLFEADFTGANILNANFEGANLNNAIWVDGKRCILGSIGKCKSN